MSIATVRSIVPRQPNTSSLADSGSGALEQLIRAIVFRRSTAVLLLDDDHRCIEASDGACKLLGISRGKLTHCRLSNLGPAEVSTTPLWTKSPQGSELSGEVVLTCDGIPCALEYAARPDILPGIHLLMLRQIAGKAPAGSGAEKQKREASASDWAEDYALSVTDARGVIVAWHAGAERVYGYSRTEMLGKHVSTLRPAIPSLSNDVRDELQRTEIAGSSSSECWQVKQNTSRFRAQVIGIALRDDDGVLQGFASVVREHPAAAGSTFRSALTEFTVVGIASGAFDEILEANDTFLKMFDCTQRDVAEGKLSWQDLTPPEQAGFNELAHEECLRFGASTPVERQLLRKDGTQILVRTATAILTLSPFRWITFVQELTETGGATGPAGDAVEPRHNFADIIAGSGTLMKTAMAQVEMVAPTDATVLILGETGTGKELVARAVHRLSPRRNQPFVTLNCAAIPTGLLESELFGHERGAFTGAVSQKMGRFEMASGGTLFLDEIGDIPIELQPKLLRALQEKAFERLGGIRTLPIDVRLIAATNRDLTRMISEKLFRSDLYYRLNVFPIATPPLRDRAEDIPLLARHFVRKYSEKMGRSVTVIPPEVMRALASWTWPGNVRELEHFIERSVILSPGAQLRAPIAELRAKATSEVTAGATLEDVEREHILKTLRSTNGVVSAAAVRLGLQRTTLNALMGRLGINRRSGQSWSVEPKGIHLAPMGGSIPTAEPGEEV